MIMTDVQLEVMDSEKKLFVSSAYNSFALDDDRSLSLLRLLDWRDVSHK